MTIFARVPFRSGRSDGYGSSWEFHGCKEMGKSGKCRLRLPWSGFKMKKNATNMLRHQVYVPLPLLVITPTTAGMRVDLVRGDTNQGEGGGKLMLVITPTAAVYMHLPFMKHRRRSQIS